MYSPSQLDWPKMGKVGPRAIYLGLLFYRPDESVGNIVKFVRHFHVVTRADTVFLHLFLLERFKTRGPKPAQYDVVEMVETKKNWRSNGEARQTL